MPLSKLPSNALDVLSAATANMRRRVVEVINQIVERGGELIDSVVDSDYAYSSTFSSGYVAYHGPDGTLSFNTNFIFGTNLPNPSGINGPCLLLGAGIDQFWVIQDTRPNGSTAKGTSLGISAGQCADSGSSGADGGDLLLYGGGSDTGQGGLARLQGGTSANGDGGFAVLKGGDATNAGGPRGDAFIQGGENGSGGGTVHLIATRGTGADGEIRFRSNSDILLTISSSGAWFPKTYGAGLAGQPLVSKGTGDAPEFLSTAYTGSVALAKLTPGGANGSLTVASGIITAYTAPT